MHVGHIKYGKTKLKHACLMYKNKPYEQPLWTFISVQVLV